MLDISHDRVRQFCEREGNLEIAIRDSVQGMIDSSDLSVDGGAILQHQSCRITFDPYHLKVFPHASGSYRL